LSTVLDAAGFKDEAVCLRYVMSIVTNHCAVVLAAATKSSDWLLVAIAGYAAATAQTMAYNMDLIKPSPFALYVKTPHQMRRIRELEELLGWPLDSFAARDVLFNGAHEQKHIAVARHLRGGARGGGRSKLGEQMLGKDLAARPSIHGSTLGTMVNMLVPAATKDIQDFVLNEVFDSMDKVDERATKRRKASNYGGLARDFMDVSSLEITHAYLAPGAPTPTPAPAATAGALDDHAHADPHDAPDAPTHDAPDDAPDDMPDEVPAADSDDARDEDADRDRDPPEADDEPALLVTGDDPAAEDQVDVAKSLGMTYQDDSEDEAYVYEDDASASDSDASDDDAPPDRNPPEAVDEPAPLSTDDGPAAEDEADADEMPGPAPAPAAVPVHDHAAALQALEQEAPTDSAKSGVLKTVYFGATKFNLDTTKGAHRELKADAQVLRLRLRSKGVETSFGVVLPWSRIEKIHHSGCRLVIFLKRPPTFNRQVKVASGRRAAPAADAAGAAPATPKASFKWLQASTVDPTPDHVASAKRLIRLRSSKKTGFAKVVAFMRRLQDHGGPPLDASAPRSGELDAAMPAADDSTTGTGATAECGTQQGVANVVAFPEETRDGLHELETARVGFVARARAADFDAFDPAQTDQLLDDVFRDFLAIRSRYYESISTKTPKLFGVNEL
jgi:hypothetical protein